MATKSNFTSEEWVKLLASPMEATLVEISAALSRPGTASV
jgi:hypothetical protein